MIAGSLYNQPKYYHVAFSTHVHFERKMLEFIFERHLDFPVRSILEPACGTGRVMVELAKAGYRTVGYDVNPAMVAFARNLIAQEQVEETARVQKGDMATFRSGQRFDAAVNLINSIGYLTSDNEIESHFRNTGNALRKGGVYIIHLDCAVEGPISEDTQGWTVERGGTRVTTYWMIVKQDFESKLSYQRCRMEIEENHNKFTIEDDHILRLWLYDDLKRFIEQSKRLRLEAIYDEERVPMDPEAHITGEMGNLFFVLKRGA